MSSQNAEEPDFALNPALVVFKSLAVPLLVLIFYFSAPSWLLHRTRPILNERVRNDLMLELARSNIRSLQLEERREAINQTDFAQISSLSVTDAARVRVVMDTMGIPSRLRRLHWGQIISSCLVGILVAGIAAIFALNRAAQRSQDDLVRCYRLAWSIGLACALVEALLLTVLLAYGLFEVSILTGDGPSPVKSVFIAIGGVIALVGSVRILLQKIPLDMQEEMSREVSFHDAPDLWRAALTAAERLGTSPPDHIVIGMQPNFYVTEAPVEHSFGRVEGKTLFLSYPLLRQLSEEEILAIAGHELGHFIGKDTQLSREFYPMRLKVFATMETLAAHPWVGWTSYQFLFLFAWIFAKTEQKISRARELVADGIAASLTSRAKMAGALVKFHAFEEAFQRGLENAIKGDEASKFDFERILRHKLPTEPEFWTKLFEERLPHPMDSHPTLRTRLEALDQVVTIEEAQAMACENIQNAYDKWFINGEALFAPLLKQTESAVGKAREEVRIETADYATPAGKQLLESHFPERKWQRRPRKPWLSVIACAIPAIAAGVLVVVVPDLVGRIILTVVVAFFVVLGIGVWIRLRNAELTLTVLGLAHTGWTRPLLFAEVAEMNIETENSESKLVVRLKERSPPLWKFAAPISSKNLSISMMRLGDAPGDVGDTIFRYFKRVAEVTELAETRSQGW